MNIFDKIKNTVKNTMEETKEKLTAKDNKKETAKEKKVKKAKKPSLKEQLIEKEQELAELKDKYLRIFAEFDNYKKRTMKEKIEFMRNASEGVLTDILPVLDDFDRAKEMADDDKTTEVFSDGVSIVYNKLNSVVKAKGLNAMVSTGELFDSELHESVTTIPAPTEEMKGKVIDTIQKGYYLHDKIIRHAKVVIGE